MHVHTTVIGTVVISEYAISYTNITLLYCLGSMHYCNKLTQFSLCTAAHAVTQGVTAAAHTDTQGVTTAAHAVTQGVTMAAHADIQGVTAAAEAHREPSQALEEETSQPMLTEGNLTITTEFNTVG